MYFGCFGEICAIIKRQSCSGGSVFLCDVVIRIKGKGYRSGLFSIELVNKQKNELHWVVSSLSKAINRRDARPSFLPVTPWTMLIAVGMMERDTRRTLVQGTRSKRHVFLVTFTKRPRSGPNFIFSYYCLHNQHIPEKSYSSHRAQPIMSNRPPAFGCFHQSINFLSASVLPNSTKQLAMLKIAPHHTTPDGFSLSRRQPLALTDACPR